MTKPTAATRRSYTAVACVGTIFAGVSASTAAADVVVDPTIVETIRTDDACPISNCWFTHVAAVQRDGVQHVVWRRDGDGAMVRTLRRFDDGTIELGTIAIDPPPFQNTVHTIEARGDLLAIGVNGRIEVHRLVDGAWQHETSLTAGLGSSPAARLAIATGPGTTERIVASSTVGFNSTPVRIYRNDGEWSLETEISEVLTSGAFGADLAIDGDTLVIGAPWPGSAQQGGSLEAFVYDFVDGAWSQSEILTGFAWSLRGIGRALALVGDTLITDNRRSANPGPSHLQVFQRGPDGFVPTDLIFGSTSKPLGWELDAFEVNGGVRVFATAYRTGSNVIIDGLLSYLIVDGVVCEETILPLPTAASTHEGMVSNAFGVAAVGGAMPWLAVTTPGDPLGSSLSIIALGDAFSFTQPDALPGDLDGNGVVDGSDLGLLLNQWGPCDVPIGGCPADLDGDGVVDGADLGILLNNWTVTP